MVCTLFERLMALIDVKKPNECWLWRGYVNHGGYGQLREGGGGSRMVLAHRVSWSLHNKKRVPTGKLILHSCDTPRCCNPKHLSPGTHRQNTAQMVARGRHVQGTAMLHSKLTANDVCAIRADTRVQRVIAAEYGVNQTVISGIRRRETWKHVKDA